MNFIKYILALVLILSSCKTHKNLANSNVRKLSIRKIVKKHKQADFDKKTINAKLLVKYKSKHQNLSFSAEMKIKKDEVIYLKGTKFITLFKAKITPDKLSFYSQLKRVYFEGDFNMLKKIIGVEITFNQLQNILLGNSVLPLDKKHELENTVSNYKVFPKNQNALFDVFYFVNPKNFKIDEQYIKNKTGKLIANYASYIKKESTFFPKVISLKGEGDNKNIELLLGVKSVDFDKDFKIRYKIPSGYKKIEL